MSNYSRAIHEFQKDVSTTTSDGNILNVGSDYNILQLEAKNTSTYKLIFEGMGSLGIWRPLLGAKRVADVAIVTGATDLSAFSHIIDNTQATVTHDYKNLSVGTLNHYALALGY